MKLLWIEDNFEVLKGLLLPLKKEGISITTAATYDAAEEAIMNASLFDIIVLDLLMPKDHPDSLDIVGLHFAKKLRKAAPKIPILVLTVLRNSRIEDKLEELDIEVLHKGTLNPLDLCQKIRSLVESKEK